MESIHPSLHHDILFISHASSFLLMNTIEYIHAQHTRCHRITHTSGYSLYRNKNDNGRTAMSHKICQCQRSMTFDWPSSKISYVALSTVSTEYPHANFNSSRSKKNS